MNKKNYSGQERASVTFKTGKGKKTQELSVAISTFVFLLFVSATVLVSGTLPNNTSVLNHDKGQYLIGETAIISINSSELEKYKLEINTQTRNYKYNGKLQNAITFITIEPGLHTIILYDPVEMTTIEKSQFQVVTPNEMQTIGQNRNQESETTENQQDSVPQIGEPQSSQENAENLTGKMQEAVAVSPNSTVSTVKINDGKSVFYLGNEVTVQIQIPDANKEEYGVYYEYAGLTHKYLGDPSQIRFIPRGLGTHKIIVRDLLYNEINFIEFDVIENNTAQDTGGEKIFEKTNPIKTEFAAETAHIMQKLNLHQSMGKEKNYSLRILQKNYRTVNHSNTPIPGPKTKVNELGNLTTISGDLSANELEKATYDVEITPDSKFISSIRINNLDTTNSQNPTSEISLGLEDLNAENAQIPVPGTRVIKAFSIDASGVNFTNGSATATATGTTLWKCKSWVFESQECVGTWERVMTLIPGQEYQIELNPEDPGYLETGVATVNTKKPIYHLNETVQIVVAILDTQGELVENANITLQVISPGNQSTTLSTSTSGIYTLERGIYGADFSDTLEEGNYTLVIAANGPDVNQTMASQFTVLSHYPFDIIRDIPASIDPWQGLQETSIKFRSYSNAPTFNYTEVLPGNFIVNNSGGGFVVSLDNMTLIKWSDLTNNSRVSYDFQAPLVTPDLHTIGPGIVEYYESSQLIQFAEARPWYLAIDPVVNSSDAADINIVALDNTTIVVAFINTGNDDASIQVINVTSGAHLASAVLNTDVNLDGRIDLAAINSTHFAIAVYDSSGGDNLEYYIYTRTGTQVLGATQTDPDAGTEVDIAIGALTNRVALAWSDPTDGDDLYGEIWDLAGTQITAEWSIDTNVLPDTILRNDVSIAGISSSRWVVGWFDDNSDAARISLYNQTGSLIAGPTTPDGSVGGTGEVAVAAGKNNMVAMAIYESDEQDMRLVIADVSSDAFTTTFAIADINTTVGTDTRLDIAAVDMGSQTYFVVAWWNQAVDTIQATVYNNSGTIITPQFTVDSDPDSTYRMLSVAGYEPSASTGLCNGTFAIAYSNDSSGAVYKLYHINGTAWNGVCGSAAPSQNPPILNSTQCNVPGRGWINCTNILFGNTVESVRASCHSQNDANISNVSFSMLNVEDNKMYFNVTSTSNATGYWEYNITDFTVYDSGSFNLHATCRENPTNDTDYNWTISWGTLSSVLNYPISSTNVTKNTFFNFSTNVTCTGGECGYVNATAYHSSSPYGTGQDGAITITSSGTVVNNYTFLMTNASSGSYNLSVNNSGQFAAGDEVLIIQMQNSSTGVSGRYEFATVSSTLNGRIIIQTPLQYNYYSGTFNSTSSLVTQIVRIPQYTNVTISSGASITAPAWNGTVGGIIIFRATGLINVTGTINAEAIGWRGGIGGPGGGSVPTRNGYQGESYPGTGQRADTTARAANAGGGGGAYGDGTGGMTDGEGGAGAGYATQGIAGGSDGNAGDGLAGNTHGLTNLTTIYLGSGGGGGGGDDAGGLNGAAGGTGGGIIYVVGQTILSSSGIIIADGQDGSTGSDWAGSGGGGAGGSIYLGASNLTLGTVTAVGGTGGPEGGGSGGTDAGGNASNGRIRLDYDSLTGVSSPTSGFNGSSPQLNFVLLSTISGYIPFYTTSNNSQLSNYAACLGNMTNGTTCTTTWLTNATGGSGTTYLFFTNYTLQNYSAYVNASNTSTVNITIVQNSVPTVGTVTIAPSAPSHSENLNCSFVVTDQNGWDTLTANVSWYRNNVLTVSELISVSNGVTTIRVLGEGNTSIGEVWHCGITPFDPYSTGLQVNSSNVTILSSYPPTPSQLECQENNATWSSCSNVAFIDIITRVRAVCSDTDGYVTNVSFSLENTQDSKIYFTGSTTDNSTGPFIFNNTDLLVRDSGTFNLNVTCQDNDNVTGKGNYSWSIPWGHLRVSLNTPTTNVNVTQNRNFNFTTNVTCTGGECGYVNATAYHSISELGSGSSGSITISSANTLINNYTYLTANAITSSVITVNHTTGFNQGDDILIVQMQNSSGGIAGRYEYAIISSISGNNITLTRNTTYSYYSGTFNTSASSVTQVVRVPQYVNLTVTSAGSIISQTWNGYYGGIIVFKATSRVNITGSVDTTGGGFRAGDGGPGGGAAATRNGYQGESYPGTGQRADTTARAANAGGGGGAYGDGTGGMTDGEGGAGAGHGTAGTAGGSDANAGDGLAGNTHGLTNLTTIQPGSGGGGGGGDDASGLNGAAGGNGGGIILITSNELIVTGTILANGSNGATGSNWAGSGGGGSGGTIYLKSVNMTIGSGLVRSGGGTGGPEGGGSPGTDAGGDAGNGRIRLDYDSLSGVSSPTSGFNGSSPGSYGLEYETLSTIFGDTPFYTTSNNSQLSNYLACLGNMISGDTCNNTWVTNATGPIGLTYDFFTRYISQNYSSYYSYNDTSHVNITITQNYAPVTINVTVYPQDPINSDNLNCTFLVRDTNSFDSLTANVTWYRNNILFSSALFSITNDQWTTTVLGSGNTSTGETWHCGVSSNDGYLTGNQLNSTNVTIAAARPPDINAIECLRNGTTWMNCTGLVFGDYITQTRVNCTSESLIISNVSLNFTNLPDSETYFNTVITSNISDLWNYSQTININNSGTFFIGATCRDNATQNTTANATWNVPWGTIIGTLIDPNTDTTVEKSKFFNFSARVSCTGGECGNINATLDPGFPGGSPSSGTPDAGTLTLGAGDDSGGAYTDTQSDNVAYYAIGEVTNADSASSTMDLDFNISVLGIAYAKILNISTNITYCHSGEDDYATFLSTGGCDGDDSQEKTLTGSQDVWIYNVTGGAFFDIGDLNTANAESEVRSMYNVSAINYTQFVNTTSGMIRIRTELVAQAGGQDTWLAVDYVTLTITYADKSGAISTVVGAIPFYTTNANPQNYTHQSCLHHLMSGGSDCNVTWAVNATGPLGTSYEFWVIYDSTTHPTYVNQSNSSHIFITIADSTLVPPSVTLRSPADITYTNNATVIFNCSATDNLALFNMSLYGNFSGTFARNATNSLGGTSNSTTFSLNLSDSSYIWNCLAYDTNGNNDWGSSNWTITVDTQKPSINLSYPNPGDVFTASTIIFNLTAYDNFDPTLVCNITIDGTNASSNFNAVNGALTSRTISNLAQGTHYWNATCYDEAGNFNTSQTRNFTISDLPPTVNLTFANGTYQRSANVTLSYLPNDNNAVINASIYLNGVLNFTTTSVMTGSENNYNLTNLLEGVYNWTVNVTDISGLSAQAQERWFTIDYTAPNITLLLPENNNITTSSSVDFRFNVTDNLDNSLVCNLTINGAVVDAGFAATSGVNTTRTVSGLADGLNIWNVTCWDNANNTGVSTTRTVNISAPPTVSLNSPAEGAYSTQNYMLLSYTPTDNTGFSNCSLILDGAINQTNSTGLINGGTNYFNATNLAAGTHNWTITCYDQIGLNATANQVRNFTIDFTAPAITLNYPLANESITSSSINFNFTATDGIDTSLLCNLTLDGSVNQSNIAAPNATSVNISVNVLTEGLHWWNITCRDDAGNYNTSENRNFTNQVPPLVTLIYPPSGYILTNGTLINFTYNPYDSGGFTNASLIINGVKVLSNSTPVNAQMNTFYYNITSDGVYLWTVNATDNIFLEGTATAINFTLDTTPPNVTIYTPNSTGTQTWNNVSFQFFTSDNLDSVLDCNVSVNGTLRWQNLSVSNGTITTNYLALSDGNYNWSVFCIDHAGWNITTNITFTVDAPPNVTLNQPLTGYRTRNTSVAFNYTPYDALGFTNCSLYIDSIFNDTETGIDANANNIFGPVNTSEGNHNWTVTCVDAAPDFNSYTPPIQNFTVDLSGPTMVLNSPSEGQTMNQNSIRFNWTATDYPTIQIICNLTIDSVVNQTGLIGISGIDFNVTVNNFTDGPHNWSVECRDDLNNSRTSYTGNFTINQPDLYINTSYIFFNNTNPDLYEQIQITANVSNIGGVTANNVLVEFWDGLPISGTFIGNSTGSVVSNGSTLFTANWNITPGYHAVWVVIDRFNLVGELNESNNNASKNISVLWVNITHPINNTIINSTNSSINFTTTDYTAGQINYTVFVGSIVNGQSALVLAGSNNTFNMTLGEGTRIITVQAIDSLGRAKNSTKVYLIVDYNAPNPTINTLNQTWFNYSAPQINISITDNVDTLINYTLFVNGTADINGNIPNATATLVNISSKPDGLYILVLQGKDDANNSANGTARTIYIDTTKPYATLNSPANNTNITSSYADFNFTAFDNLANYLMCNITVDATTYSGINVSNGISANRTITGFSEGAHYWNVTCIDQAGNTNTSETRTVNIFKAPALELFSPTNNTLTRNTSLLLLFNATDDTGLENCTLILNGALNETKAGSQLINGGLSNFTVNNLNGTYLWAVTCYDNTSLNVQNTSLTWQFTADIDAPQPIILTQNGTWMTNSSPQIRFNITDNFDTNISYTLFVNGISNATGNILNASLGIATLVGITPDGIYTIIVQGTDDAGNQGNSTSITILVDTTVPSIVQNAPQNGVSFNATSVQFNFTPIDNMASYLICNLTVSGGFSQLNINATNNTLQSINKSSFTSGIYYWNVTCYDIAGNSNTTTTFNFTINAPDLLITTANVSFNTSTFEEGQNLTIYANVYNIGGTNASNITVQFWIGNPQSGGSQINGNLTISSLAPFENKTVNVTYSSIVGINNIYVEVDPRTWLNGSIVEENESNNQANKTFEVSLYQIFAGNLSASIEIEKQSINLTLFNWTIANSSGSYVFVSDTGMNINFLSLQSLGRNTTNGTSGGVDDFYDLDNKIATSNLTDSLNRTYTASNVPKETMNLTVFERNLIHIPVVNSTNSSNFKTGILWDTSDGGVQYNGTQDVVLISPVNQDSLGSRGIYDFEVAVPAYLRNYNVAGNSVAFYFELK